jgi:hypothetical protein
MGTEGVPADRRKAVSAAVRWFPQFELTIHRLMDRDDAFRDMCEELAEAELALSRVNDVPPAWREARRVEWEDLVQRLVGEVGAVILKTDAVARSRVTPRPPQ